MMSTMRQKAGENLDRKKIKNKKKTKKDQSKHNEIERNR